MGCRQRSKLCQHTLDSLTRRASSDGLLRGAPNCVNGGRSARRRRDRWAAKWAVLQSELEHGVLSVKVLSAREAIKNRSRQGDFAVWALWEEQAAAAGYDTTTPDMGGARAYNGLLTPRISPKFKLGANPKVFASGSCFARELESAMARDGGSVVSWTPDSGIEGEILNRYNTYSIGNDFEFAFRDSYDERLAIETPWGWIDYTAAGRSATQAELVEKRLQVIRLHRNVLEADVMIITLGLIEAWFDRETNRYLNATPGEVLSSNLSRYECRITDYSENLQALQALVVSLREFAGKDLKIVITVSPVPFTATFSSADVVQANTLSKSTLRTVAQAIADQDPLIDYFPSYEIVTLSDPQVAWLPDHRHVRHEAVRHVVQTFRNAYLEQGDSEGVNAA